MTAPLSLDLRRRIVRAVEAGNSARQVAERFEVSPSAAIKLMRRVRETGSPAPGQIGGHRRPMLEAHADLIRALVAGKSRITLAELQAALGERGIEVKALSTISLMLRRLGLTHKKTP
jgi:transposase